MAEIIPADFVRSMLQIGILSYREHETLFQIARRCARSTGIPMAGGGLILGINAGTIALPGIGTISGAAAGALSGLVAGTLSCTALNMSLRKELGSLARGASDQ